MYCMNNSRGSVEEKALRVFVILNKELTTERILNTVK